MADDPPPRAGPDDVRLNRLTGKLTVIAPGRRARPRDVAALGGEASQPATDSCPFCAGHEAMTPPEVDAVRDDGTAPDGPGWRVRVVPNKYPALKEGHEVVVHSPEHGLDLEDLDDERLVEVLEVWQRRIAAQYARGAAAALLILNRGSGSGASLSHPHEQLFAMPVVPPLLQEELLAFERHRSRFGACLLCDELDRVGARRSGEREQGGERLVLGGPLAAWVPEAPRFAYELWLAPAAHEESFLDAEREALAPVLRSALHALTAASEGAPLNMWVHTMPPRMRGTYHWHIEMVARTSALAGFELGGDVALVSQTPEASAERLRAALSEG
jgi:UDPglucose--hexose-1-phosphate uridylyltransferase